MSVGYRGKTTNLPRENNSAIAQGERESAWGNMTGTIVSFDPGTQTASVQPDYKPIHDGTPVTMPQLDEVPVRFSRAGGFIITKPVKAGDKVELRPQIRSSEEYHAGGDYTPDRDTRTYSLSDMEAHLDGGEPLSDPIANFNNTNMEIRSKDGQFKIEMSEDGKFKIQGKEGNAFELLTEGFEKLGQEPTLIYKDDYAEIGAKLRGMMV